MNSPAASASIIHLPLVLVLNRAWQAIGVRTVGLAIGSVMTGAATPLDVTDDGAMHLVATWNEWLMLPVRPHDRVIGTVRGPVHAPTIIVCARFAKVPTRRPSFSARAVRQRDGNRCQYTGRLLAPGEGSLDHVLPRSCGGAHGFENVVLACRKVNHRKANRTPEEAGLRLLARPKAPLTVPFSQVIRNVWGIVDWAPFVVEMTTAVC